MAPLVPTHPRHRPPAGARGSIGPRALAALALALAPALISGCAEWDRYWKASPTRPYVARDTTPPTVKLRSPAGPDTAHATPVAGSYLVVLEVQDDVAIARVELHLDNAPGVPVSGPPWELAWNTTPLAEGSTHRLWAAALDAAGNLGVSDTVYAQVFNSGPPVVIAQPVNGALVLGSIPVAARFDGAAPEIERMDWLVDDQVFSILTQPPWTAVLDTRTLTAGDHFLAVRALSTLQQVGVSPAVRVRVNNETPAVAIDFPDDGHRIAPRGTLILSGTATDPLEGKIPDGRVQWRSSLDGPIGSGRYLRIRGLSVGLHQITVTAVNLWGTEQSVSTTVEVAAQPSVTFCRDIYNGIFRSWCVVCHAPDGRDFASSQLDLRSYAGLMAGGITRTYETVVPCRPESSLVWNKVTADIPWVGQAMPPRDEYRQLPATLLEKLRTWISEGAPPDDPEACN